MRPARVPRPRCPESSPTNCVPAASMSWWRICADDPDPAGFDGSSAWRVRRRYGRPTSRSLVQDHGRQAAAEHRTPSTSAAHPLGRWSRARPQQGRIGAGRGQRTGRLRGSLRPGRRSGSQAAAASGPREETCRPRRSAGDPRLARGSTSRGRTKHCEETTPTPGVPRSAPISYLPGSGPGGVLDAPLARSSCWPPPCCAAPRRSRSSCSRVPRRRSPRGRAAGTSPSVPRCRSARQPSRRATPTPCPHDLPATED